MATKTFKVALSLDNPRIIQSGIDVRSFDKQSIKIAIELTKNSQTYQIPTGAQIKISLLKIARQEQKIILDVPFTSAEAIDWLVPDYLDGYQGEVRVGVYLIVGTENIDVGYFNITSKVSDIDKASEEFTDSVMQGWDQVEADLAEIRDMSTQFEALASDVTSKYNAFDSSVTQAGQTIDDILALQPQFQSVLDETTGKDVISAPEIILARGGATTLGERLDSEKAEVTAQLAQTNDKEYTFLAVYNNGTSTFDLGFGNLFTKIKIEKKNTIVTNLVIDIIDYPALAMVDIGLYDKSMKLIARAGEQQVLSLGLNSFPIPSFIIESGDYFIGVASNTAVKIRAGSGNGFITKKNYPVVNSATSLEKFHTAPFVEVHSNNINEPVGFEMQVNDDVRTFARSDNNGRVYGWNVTAGRIAVSQDNGATFTNLMLVPEGVWDMQVDDVNGRLYFGTANGKIYESNGMLSTSSFSEITPNKHINAKLLPHGIIIWKGYLFYGEYSHVPNELDVVKIHKYNLTTKVWSISASFTDARHVHSFTAQGTSALYVTLGDAGYGVNVGIHRITSTGDGEDAWVRITQNSTANAHRSSHYPVDNIIARVDGKLGLLGAGDREKLHLTWTKLEDTILGYSNINARLYGAEDAGAGETARNVLLDDEKNAYYVTEETTVPRLYVSPYPYTKRYKLYDFPRTDYLTTKAVKAGDWILFHKYRFHTVSFGIPKDVTIDNNMYLYNSKEINSFTEESNGSQSHTTIKNQNSLFIESLSDVDLTIQYAGFRTTSQIDLTNINNIIVEGKFINNKGINQLRLKVDTATTVTTKVKEMMLENLNYNVTHPFSCALDVSTLTGNHYFSVQSLAWNLDAKSTIQIDKIYAL